MRGQVIFYIRDGANAKVFNKNISNILAEEGRQCGSQVNILDA